MGLKNYNLSRDLATTPSEVLILALMERSDLPTRIRLRALFPNEWWVFSLCSDNCDDVESLPSKDFTQTIMMGSGTFTKLDIAQLHNRLDEGLSDLSGLQQQDLQGEGVDWDGVREGEARVKRVILDIATSLGHPEIVKTQD